MKTFKNTVIKTWNARGEAWLQSLPSLIAACTALWKLRDLKPVTNLSYNYVMTGFQEDLPVVLKLGCDANELGHEKRALESYQGIGCVQLRNYSSDYNALLLEQAIPGTSLITYFPNRDDEARVHAVEIIKLLHKAQVPPQTQTLQTWFRGLFTPHPALSSYHIDKAQELTKYLLASQKDTVLLHGDLHHDNIVLSERGWLALDPKGIHGEAEFDACSFIVNPLSYAIEELPIPQRVSYFSEQLSVTEERIYQWLYARAVLNACWTMEEQGAEPIKALRQADVFKSFVS